MNRDLADDLDRDLECAAQREADAAQARADILVDLQRLRERLEGVSGFPDISNLDRQACI